MNDYAGDVDPTLADPNASKYLAGVGLQYAGVGMIPSIRATAAGETMKLWETETPCGDGRRSS